MNAPNRVGCFILLLLLLPCCAPDTPEPATTMSAKPVSRTTDYHGRKVHYLDTGGSGPAIVLVHGWASDTSVWVHQLEGLRSRARVLAIDLPGHGQSELPSSPFSMDLFASATAAVLDDAGIDQATLIGHSNGAPVVRQFYRFYPDRTQALIALDGPLKLMFSDELAAGVKASLSGPDAHQTAVKMIENMPGDGLGPDTRKALTEMVLRQPAEAVRGGFEAATDPKIWQPDPISVPLLLALAAQPAWNDEYLAFVRQLAPHVQIDITEGVSHFLMMERPGEFHALIFSFLERHGILKP